MQIDFPYAITLLLFGITSISSFFVAISTRRKLKSESKNLESEAAERITSSAMKLLEEQKDTVDHLKCKLELHEGKLKEYDQQIKDYSFRMDSMEEEINCLRKVNRQFRKGLQLLVEQLNSKNCSPVFDMTVIENCKEWQDIFKESKDQDI